MQWTPTSTSLTVQNVMQQYLKLNQHLIKNKTVLDLACHDGISTGIIKKLGAKHIYGVEARQELLAEAKKNIKGDVDFFVGDIQDEKTISSLVEKSDTVVALGVLYHLYNHFGFLSYILKPNIDYVLIETIAGPETLATSMAWGFEKVDHPKNGWHPETVEVPHGTPNLSWIFATANIFGFSCDWAWSLGDLPAKTRHNITQKEYTQIKQSNWPKYEKIISNDIIQEKILNDISTMLVDDSPEHAGKKRIVLRLYNRQRISSTPINLEDCYVWSTHKRQGEKNEEYKKYYEPKEEEKK
jgi:SAM-dependent methyltransferase